MLASITINSPVRFMRVARGIAQADLALACGIGASLLSDIERGRARASDEIVAKLASALECDPSARREHAGLRPRTLEHLRWCLNDHLLPTFRSFPLDRIDAASIDAKDVMSSLSASTCRDLLSSSAARVRAGLVIVELEEASCEQRNGT